MARKNLTTGEHDAFLRAAEPADRQEPMVGISERLPPCGAFCLARTDVVPDFAVSIQFARITATARTRRIRHG